MATIPITRIPGPHHTVIDCAECTMFESDHCSDCVVTFLCDGSEQESSTAVVFDMAEMRAVKLLSEAGLVPTLRHSATG